MKVSQFNVHKQLDDGSYWVYNTLTTAFIKLSHQQFSSYFESSDWNEHDPDFQELFDMGFFIDDDFNELEYLKSLRESVVNSNKKIADIMIAPTMDCNARCYYCFEHGCHHDKMTIETADAVVKYIKENWNHDLFNVTWFGGEPLLATDIIDYISEKLKENGICFISKITTNGYALDSNAIQKALTTWHTSKIQISIDALFDEYNRIKNYKFPGDAFHRVIENARNALTAGLTVRIRINFNPLEKRKATDLMTYLQSEFGGFSNFSSYFAPIDADPKVVPSIAGNFFDMPEHPFLSLIKFSEQYGYFNGNSRGKEGNFLYDEKGLLRSLKLYPSPTNCYASCPSVFAIDSKGDLYKCHRVLGKGGKYCSGNVKTGIAKNEIYNFFCNTDFSFKECSTCKLLPLCQGGCKINAFVYGDDHACAPIKPILLDLIDEYFKKITAQNPISL